VCVACGVLGDEVVAAGVGWVANLVVVHAADETTARRAGHGRCTHGRSGSGPVMSGIWRMVDSNRGESCRLAPAATRATGMPRPSVTTERLVPCLPRSTGDRPEKFSSAGRFGDRPIQ